MLHVMIWFLLVCDALSSHLKVYHHELKEVIQSTSGYSMAIDLDVGSVFTKANLVLNKVVGFKASSSSCVYNLGTQ